MTPKILHHPTVQGPIYMLIGYCFLGLSAVLVKYASMHGVHAPQITFVRFAVSCILVYLIARGGLGRVRVQRWGLVIARGIFGAVAVLLYFYAIQYTTAGKGTLLNYTHSLWANVYAVVLFGARPPRFFWATLGLAGVGIWLVTDPQLQSFNAGDVMGLISGMMGGAAILTIKELRRTENSLTIFASFAVFGVLVSGATGLIGGTAEPGYFREWIAPATGVWAAMIGVGGFTTLGQLFFGHGFGYTSIPMGTLLSLSVPIVAALGGLTFLAEPLTPHFALGGVMVLAACGILGVQESAARRAELKS